MNEFNEASGQPIHCDLREILKEGGKIRTKFLTGSEWINNTISFIEIDRFEMPLKFTYVMNNICKGDAMTFKYTYENSEYVINGIVDEINLYDNVIAIHTNKIEKFVNKRKENRFDVSLCSYLIYDYEKKPIYSLIKNISRNGISISTKVDLEIGYTFGLDIFISKDKIISLICKVLRKSSEQNNYLYDCELESINENSKEFFEELFSVLEKYDDELLFDYINSSNKT